MGVPEDNTNLGRGQTLLGQLEDLVLHLVTGDLQPLRNRPMEGIILVSFQGGVCHGCPPPVGKCRLADALSRRVHPTHTGSLLTSL